MILIGKNNNTSTKIEPTSSNNYSPIKIGNANGKAINVMKIFIGDQNNKAKEIYFIPLYDFRHTFSDNRNKKCLIHVYLKDLENRDPSNTKANCDTMDISGDNYVQIDPMRSNNEDFAKYGELLGYNQYISNLYINGVRNINNDNISFGYGTFPLIEELEFDDNLESIKGFFNDCINLKSVVFNNNEDMFFTPSIVNSFKNMYNGSYILTFNQNWYDGFINSGSINEILENTIIYKCTINDDISSLLNDSLINISIDNLSHDNSISLDNYLENYLGNDSVLNAIGTNSENGGN